MITKIEVRANKTLVSLTVTLLSPWYHVEKNHQGFNNEVSFILIIKFAQDRSHAIFELQEAP
jgi:hypothetical protein